MTISIRRRVILSKPRTHRVLRVQQGWAEEPVVARMQEFRGPGGDGRSQNHLSSIDPHGSEPCATLVGISLYLFLYRLLIQADVNDFLFDLKNLQDAVRLA
jgi:hypothetical protein